MHIRKGEIFVEEDVYGSRWKGNGGWRGVLVRIFIIYPFE